MTHKRVRTCSGSLVYVIATSQDTYYLNMMLWVITIGFCQKGKLLYVHLKISQWKCLCGFTWPRHRIRIQICAWITNSWDSTEWKVCSGEFQCRRTLHCSTVHFFLLLYLLEDTFLCVHMNANDAQQVVNESCIVDNYKNVFYQSYLLCVTFFSLLCHLGWTLAFA